MTTTLRRRRLIEVAFPLEEVSADSAIQTGTVEALILRRYIDGGPVGLSPPVAPLYTPHSWMIPDSR